MSAVAHNIKTDAGTDTALAAAAAASARYYHAEMLEDMIVPVARCLYTCHTPSRLRKEYFSSFLVQHPSEQYRWKVHIGDVVAVSTAANNSMGAADCVTLEELEKWQPNHLKKASPHWKVGLVVALIQVVDPQKDGRVSHECHVEWLEKALDTPSGNVKKLSETYRKWSKQHEKDAQLPHILLRSYRYGIFSPAELLPVRITMLGAKEFMTEKDLFWDPDYDRFSFGMHCPKYIHYNADGTMIPQPDSAMDTWPELNHASFAKKSGKIPKALQQAWAKWEPVQEDDDLLQALIQGFQDACASKHHEYLTLKNKQAKEQKRLDDEEKERLRLEEEKKQRKLQKNQKGKRTVESEEEDPEISCKRVRIHEPGDTPKAADSKQRMSPSKSKKTKRTEVKSIIKKSATTKSVKLKFLTPKSLKSKPPKSSTTKTTGAGGDTTPSTKSSTTVSSLSPLDCLPNLRLSKKQQAMTVQVLGETMIHSGRRQGQACEFYERVNLSTDREAQPRVIMVGEVVAVVKEKESYISSDFKPFDGPWGVAQILALYQVKETSEWIMQVRWLLRFVELPHRMKDRLKRRKIPFNKKQGLMETMQIGISPIQAILPVHVEVGFVTKQKLLKQLPDFDTMDYNTLPVLHFQCQHFQDVESDSIASKNDWKDFSASSNRIKGPLHRAFKCMNLHARLIEKYKAEVKGRSLVKDEENEEENDDEGGGESSDEEEPPPPSLRIQPLTNKPIFEQWGVKFHDGVRIDIDRGTLHSSFSPQTTQWTVQVGYVIPIMCEIDDDPAKPRRTKKDSCYPFICNWNPAQIISIYEDEAGRWKMQIRWFYRFVELLEQQKAGVEELAGKPHVVFETEYYDHIDVDCCLPGRVVLSSSMCDDWDVAKSNISGLPLIPRFCSHICLDEDLDDAPDWTNYDVLLPSCPRPLKRGLLLEPRNRTNKDWILMLSRRYMKHINLRGEDPDSDILRKWEGQGPSLPHQIMKSTMVEFDETKLKVEIGKAWHTETKSGESSRIFAGSVNVSVSAEFIVSPSKGVRKAKKLQTNVNVGDVVAYHDTDACQRSDHVLMKHLKYPWTPFRVPWSFGQVLAIFCDLGENSSEQPLLLEIRRFYRNSEIPAVARSFTPLNDDAEREEIFETDDVISTISASRILGLATVYLGKHERASKAMDGREFEALVSCRCKYFYHASHGRFQPIFSSGFSPETWWDRMFARGVALSALMQSNDALKEATVSWSKRQNSLDVSGLLGGAIVAQVGGTGKVCSPSETERSFFTGAAIPPIWSEFVQSDVLFHENDRNNIIWEFRLGDVIAVKDDSLPVNKKSSALFPFHCQWTPCQLLAIYSDGSNLIEKLSFEVRYFSVKDGVDSSGLHLREIYQSSASDTGIVGSLDLLGPVAILRRGSQSSFDLEAFSKQLPCAIFVFENESRVPELKEAMHLSSSYTEESLACVMKALGSNVSSTSKGANFTSESIVSNSVNAEACGSPVFVDISRLQIFYREFRTVRSQRLFENTSNDSESSWDVKTGDVVLLHCDGAKRYPFKCNWGVAEIVAIWKQFETRDDLEKEAHLIGRDDSNNLKVEIRWFYERRDVVGQSGAVSEMNRDEVFETDDVFILDDLTTILAPANLLPEPIDDQCEEELMDSTVQSFLCRRFWSTNRKSLIPCGDLAGRERRARMYSQVIPKAYPLPTESSTRSSGEGVYPIQKTGLSSMDWSEAVKRIIAKLNLKEASKCAYDRGETLVGREKELSQLLSFFRAAIHGEPGPGGIRSSIFLAGAPGVGKTACIRSAISRLQLEQAQGDLPTFNFIPLNGMEMRHPFEAYVKLWEAITGRKHVGSHEKACQKLEYHFTNPKAITPDDENSVTVVLLDEIDYLVTEKQSVLYNFFDWPKRAASVPDGRKLVVIGISNTLNLAEQLMPSVQSRVGSERIVFKAYSVNDARAILKAKIMEASPNYSIFENDAILFAAKKTAAMSGDIRKAFQICRGAAELLLSTREADKENAPKGKYPTIRIGDVQKASRESFDSALVTAVSFSTSFQALLLVSLASLCRTTGREVGGFDILDIMTKMEALSGSFGDPQYAPPPAFGETVQLLNRLSETNLVSLRTASSSSTSFRSCGGGSGGAWPMTSLAVDEHTIVRGLKNTSHKALAEKSLPSLY